MVASSSSNAPASKPLPLSYAERARRAGASSTSQTAPRTLPTGPNGKTRSGDESTSPASSSRNLTPNSSTALTLPGSPPPSSSQTSSEEQQAFPPIPKSPAKPPPQNVWTQRRVQMARAQGHASASVQTEGNSQQISATTNRTPLNGVTASLQSDDSMSVEHDPFVVHVPPHGHAQGRTNVSSASLTPPSLDDDENWPEMGKGGPSTSTSISGSVADTDKKEGPSKKAEKTKWVPIPPAELQATHDAMVRSAASSRAQSQHRRNNQAKSRSRQQSQARPSHSQNPSQNRAQNQTYLANLSNSSGAGPKLGDTSSTQSRAESTTHSRTTSVHSSPRISTRGRRLPEEQPSAANALPAPNIGSSALGKKLPNGIPVPEEQAPLSQPTEAQNQPLAPHAYQDNAPAFVGSAPPLSGPHSQSQTPYSHSPVYFPVPPSSGPQGFSYGPIPPGVAYGAPPPAPSPASGGAPVQQQGFIGFAPYSIPQQFPPGQPPYAFMYQPVPFPYYPTMLPDQQLDVQQQHQASSQQGGDITLTQLSPVLPPASYVTRPPPPQESGPLSGYRAIAPVPVSPLLGGSAPRQSMNEVIEPTPEMVFGSVGRPGGMKSPSPAPVASSAGRDEQQSRKTPTAFAVGFDGSTAIRAKRTPSGKDAVDEVADAINIIDLTDKGSKWEFGTSSHPDAEPLPGNGGEQGTESYEPDRSLRQQTDAQILQPQPHHMLHYPPPNAPSAFQVGGYNVVPQMHLHLPSVPMPSQSPQNNAQPLPSHVPSLAPLPLNPGFVSPLALSSPGPVPQSGGPVPPPISGIDEFEVRDFGYGFGPLSGSGYIPERMREERHERDTYRDMRDNFREPRDFGGPGGSSGYGAGRIRRSSTSGGYGGGYFEGGRGGFGGRRGRGQNGPGRGFPRGAFAGRGGHGNFQRHQPSLSVSTGPFQQQQNMQQQQPQASPDISTVNSYFISPNTSTSQYLASPYGQFNPGFPHPQPQPQTQPSAAPQSLALSHPQAPPVPVPVTTLSFPLDPTRLYLLGQLEYYFSVQNLASDLFLRKQMDSKGWIPINLIASFNRVRQLTQDPQLVKEVLGISSLVEVRGEYVRLSNQQWVSFVLPSAPVSTVEGEEAGSAHRASGIEVDKENEEGEDDDVVFILGGDGSRPWTGAS